MKSILVILAVLATVAYAALPSDEYLPPLEDNAPLQNVDLQSLSESSPLGDDGYRYRTVKRYRLRSRRDVNELSSEYLPPVQSAAPVADIPVFGGEAAVQQVEGGEESAVLADDGYHYRAIKRYRYRHR